jgi:hypothetical protein
MDLQGRENRRMQYKCSYQLKLPRDKAIRPEHAMLQENPKKQRELFRTCLKRYFQCLTLLGHHNVLPY